MFFYFGYGSNLSETALRAKRVQPVSAEPAILEGWRLCYDIRNFFSIEGGTGNIVEDPAERVHGVLYGCSDQDLAALDELEALDVAYARHEMTVQTYDGRSESAYVYVGLKPITSEGLKPSRRYLNILIQGAERQNLDPAYIQRLRSTEVCHKPKFGKFRFPSEPKRQFSRADLAAQPEYTAIAGAVFDMADARVEHQYLRQLLGGRDVTLFFLQRMDSSDNDETWEQIESGDLSPLQKDYLNDYLHQFNREYRYVGQTHYSRALRRPSIPSIRPRRLDSLGEIASRRVLRTAETVNSTLGHENLGFLSETAGFMPKEVPLSNLPPSFEAWDTAASKLTELYSTLRVRHELEGMPILACSDADLPDRFLLRAGSLLAMLAHAYWYSETAPPRSLPDSIARPWSVVRRRLGRADQALSYIDLIVYNWRVLDATRSNPLRADNLGLLIPTVDNREERTFYLTQTEILARSTPIVGAVVRAQEGIAHDDPKAVCDELLIIIESLQGIVREALLNINPNPVSSSFVNPIVWAKTVAPFAVPMQPGVQGPSGTSSPIFNLLDIFFGRSAHETFLGREIRQLRSGYPLFWREFLGAVGEVSISKYVAGVDEPTLTGLLKDAVEVYAGDNGFLGRHRMKVYGYLEQAFKVGRSVTIGGFAGVFKDRTWDKVDSELEYSRVERLESFPRGCHYAHVRSVGQTHEGAAEGVKHVVLDVQGTGVRYAAGDRCGILPENSNELVDRTLAALGATGDELLELTPEWQAAVRLRWGYGDAKQLSLRDVLRFGRIRPLIPRVAEALQAATQNPELLRAILDQTTTRWELWDSLKLVEKAGYDPTRLWQAPLRSSEHICRVVPPESFRMYSIASVKEAPGREAAAEIELTVGRVRYSEAGPDGEVVVERLGSSSNFLASLAGRKQPVSFVIQHPARFSLPDNETAPIVMLAGGTGISPFRSFLLERVRRSAGRNYLFLALRSYENFYYQDELLHWADTGKLSLQVAFSRDDIAVRYVRGERGGRFVREDHPRRHIDDLVLDDDNAELLRDLIRSRAQGGQGAYIYICGRSRFARTVHEAFRELLRRLHPANPQHQDADADQLLSEMVAEGRYMQEIFTDARTWNQERKRIDVSEIVDKNDPKHGYWLVIDNLVYDLSEFLYQHPGGTHVLASYAGTDATLGYQRAHRNRSEIDAMREMYEIGQVRPLDFGAVARSITDETGSRTVALGSLHRAWVQFTYLVVEMQNALWNDQSLQVCATIACESPEDRSNYKLQRAIETHARFLRNYLDPIKGDASMRLWRLAHDLCAPRLAGSWMQERCWDVDAMESTRFVEAITSRIGRNLSELGSNRDQTDGQRRTALASLLDAIFAQDRSFLARIKALLKGGLVLFETYEHRTLEQAGEGLIKLLAGIPDAVEQYYLAVAQQCREAGWFPSEIPEASKHDASRDQVKTLISTDYWLMEENESRNVTFIKRHAVPIDSLDELLRQNHELIALMRPEEEGFGVVVDMRQAPSRNDPEFENAMSQFRSEIYRHYSRVAVLVTSAVGVLQVNRMARDEGADTFATQSETAAVRFAAGS